jgi:hypothetical protein
MHSTVDVARLLIDRGVNVDHQSKDGCTALFWASAKNSIDVARLLIDRGANIDLQNNIGWTALFWASVTNSIDVARLLIDHGANIKHQSTEGKTALCVAQENNHIDLVCLLKERLVENEATKTIQTATDSSGSSVDLIAASSLEIKKPKQFEELPTVDSMNDEIDKSRKDLVNVVRGETLEPIELCQVYVEQCTKNFAHRLGSGAFGEVYFGNDEQENIYFAVKKVPFEVTSDEIENIIRTLQMSVRIPHLNKY